jgi:hypothetical protein
MCRRGLFIVTTLTQEEGARKVRMHRRQQVPPSMIPEKWIPVFGQGSCSNEKIGRS